MHLARLLRLERERRGISMTVLAAKAGLSQQMVSYVERQMRIPTIDTLLRLSGALDLDLWRVLQKATKEARKISR